MSSNVIGNRVGPESGTCCEAHGLEILRRGDASLAGAGQVPMVQRLRGMAETQERSDYSFFAVGPRTGRPNAKGASELVCLRSRYEYGIRRAVNLAQDMFIDMSRARSCA